MQQIHVDDDIWRSHCWRIAPGAYRDVSQGESWRQLYWKLAKETKPKPEDAKLQAFIEKRKKEAVESQAKRKSHASDQVI